MNDLLDDYTKAEFPLDLPWSYGKCRLLGAIGDKVVGATCHITTHGDGSEILSLSQSLHWNGQGIYGSGEHPSMNLPPPPAKVAARVAELQDQIAEAQGRLDSAPDAPQEWRSIDERAITRNMAEIARLTEGKDQ